jgi:hypothetical protein
MSRVNHRWVYIFFTFRNLLSIGRVGASKIRRLILLLSVGCLPPYLHPSGACLSLGTSIPYGALNATEDYTQPGLRLFQ